MNNSGQSPITTSMVESQVQQMLSQALVFHQKGQLARSLALCEQVLLVQPRHFDVLHLMGIIAAQTKQFESAIELICRAIQIDPRNAAAHNNCGNVLQELRQHQAALESYNKAIVLKPDYAEAYNNRGIVLLEFKQYQAALENYDRAITLKPDYADAHNNRGNALSHLKQLQAALESYDKAIFIKSNFPKAHNNRGNVLQELKRHQAALESYNNAISFMPDFADAYNNRGNTFRILKQHRAALESYYKAIALKPDIDFLYGLCLHTKMHICDWTDIDAQCNQFAEKIAREEKVSPPFPVLAITSSLVLQRKVAEIWVQNKYPGSYVLPIEHRRPKQDRIRLGYFSADFHDHATSYLMAELFEEHDRTKFELIAFSFGPNKNDEMRKRVSAAFDKFIDVQTLSDTDVALLSRNLGIDIAVDLKGFTQDNRTGIFASRAAPIQVNFLGYPGTMGAEYIDYLIADHTLVPQNSEQYYSEKIAYLPNSYQCNDSKRRISDRQFTREDLGLPEADFVFCCFNKSYKITPSTFDVWIRILKSVDRSVLWLFEDTPNAASNLRKAAEQRGISGNRLIFAKPMPLAEHLARHRLADLFLDTLPCNAHTTASDSLWAGLPILTLVGEAFAGRVTASLLNAIHLPELITSTQAEYEALAITLATNPIRMRDIKEKLAYNRLTTPLFDTQLFTQHIEAAYIAMHQHYLAGSPPEHIDIQAKQLRRVSL